MRVISLFAGIGGFDLGFEQSGFNTVAHVERDVSCRKLLAAKFPDADAFYDVASARGVNLPKCDVLTAGFPCQDVSVAGLRAGLAGNRTGLFYQFTRIAYELKPAFIVWENVPGLLSSNKGHDFLAVIAEFRRIGYNGGWRTLDAQYFGLAQRRRRIFGVFARRDIGAASCAEILSLHEGMRGHPAPSRKAGTSITSSLTRGLGSGGADDNKAHAGHLVTARSSGRGYWTEDESAATLGTEARAVHESTLIAHTLRGEGFDASEDGTGRGTPLVVAFEPHHDEHEGRGVNFRPTSLHPTLRGPHGADNALIAFPQRMSGTQCATAEDISPSLQSVNPTAVAFQESQSGCREYAEAGCLGANGPGHDPVGTRIRSGSRVRCLTPRECERLQGFPDDWTAGFADSTRYRMLGNAVAVPCARWIASRLKKFL